MKIVSKQAVAKGLINPACLAIFFFFFFLRLLAALKMDIRYFNITAGKKFLITITQGTENAIYVNPIFLCSLLDM